MVQPPAKLRTPRSSLISLGTATIKLVVGSNHRGLSRETVVHASCLERSPYLKRLLNTQTNTLALPLEKMDHVYQYINFLYTGCLVTDRTGETNASTLLHEEHELLADLYLLGHKFQDSSFKNAVVDTILDISYLNDEDGHSHLPVPDFVSGGTLLNSPARRCLLDLYASRLDPDGINLNIAIERPFMQDVFKVVLRKIDVKSENGGFRGKKLKKCDYHEHANGVRCSER